jgi:hypothetical protein
VKYTDLDSDILLRDKLVLEGGAKLEGSRRIPIEKPGIGISRLDEGILGNPVKTYK